MHNHVYKHRTLPGRLCLLGLFLMLALSACLSPALAVDDTAPATEDAEQSKERSFSTGTNFFDHAALSGGLYYFQRDRRRYDPARGRHANNLNHATLQANADFASGFIGDIIGVDFAVFGSHDVKNTGSVDHEMSFVPWNNPWHPNWSKRHTEDGLSIYKAHIKAKAGPFWGRAGYFQPSGPTTLGVNWSVMPGTYRGVNAGADFGGLSLALAWADAYKAPWFKDMNDFRKNDGETKVPWIWSSGLRYTFDSGLMLEGAYGESKQHLWNGQFKTAYAFSPGYSDKDTLSIGYQLYLMGDLDHEKNSPNENFAGIASHHYAFAHYETGPWLFKLEGTYTRAPFSNEHHVGYFAYRLTDRNGSSKGAYDVWWDARSDWNAHNEKAVFAGIQRSLDDVLPLPGFYLGAGAALGWDGKAYGVSEHFKEWAFTVDLGYVKPDGPLKGAFVKLHFTEYRNGTDKPSWEPYKNAFQSEHDIKLFAGIPFDL